MEKCSRSIRITVHVPSEWVFTFNQNECSFWARICTEPVFEPRLKFHQLTTHKDTNMLDEYLRHLKDYETKMKRDDAISKMPFSQLAPLVLEARAAIIEKVTTAIPANNSLPILFIIGDTGAGTSTTFCHLRNDDMIYTNGFKYISNDDMSNYIGCELAYSHTFFPNIALLNDIILVDFPSFSSTYGAFLNLSIELAFKALIQQYHPYLLALQYLPDELTPTIQNRLSEYKSQLNRLVLNVDEACLFGITKYCYDWSQIKDIEQALITQLEETKKQIKTTTNDLECLIQLQSKNPESSQLINEFIDTKQHELTFIQESEKTTKKETEEKLSSLQKLIEKKEKLLLTYFKMEKFIRLRDLEQKDNVAHHLNVIKTSCIPVHINPELSLDNAHYQLIKKAFIRDEIQEKDCMPSLPSNSQYFSNFESLKSTILKTSLVAAIKSQEVADFFHLPEMELKLVKELDQELIGYCYQAYRMAINDVLKFNSGFLKQIKAFDVNSDSAISITIKKLNKELDFLENARKEIDKKLSEEEKDRLEKIRCNYFLRHKSIFILPTWTMKLSYIPNQLENAKFSIFGICH